MRGELFGTICRVGIFIICARAIVHFRPGEAYERFLKLLVSVMVLIQLFLPMGRFLLGDGMEEAVKRLGRMQEELEREMELTAGEAAEADRMLESMTLEEIRRRLEEQEAGGEEAGNSETVGDREKGAEEELREPERREGGSESSVEEISVTVDPIVRGSGD